MSHRLYTAEWPKTIIRGLDLTGYCISSQDDQEVFKKYRLLHNPDRLVCYRFGYWCEICSIKFAHYILPTKLWRWLPRKHWYKRICMRCWRKEIIK